MKPCADLLPDRAPGEDPDKIIMLMQVTQFDCGGFIVGVDNSHCISDGLGTAQFLNALAELAGGLSSPSITPIWCPAAIPSPPPTLNLRRATINLSLPQINAFKAHFLTSSGEPCSSFEAIAATLWQSRTRAVLKNAEYAQVRLVFMANARPLVRPPLPTGFCSNCFFPVNVSASGEWLASATAVEVVRLIKEAKGRLPAEFRRWEAGEGEDPYMPELGYGTLFLSEWSRLGFEKVNYGWGTPKLVVPLMYSDLIPAVIIGAPPPPATGIRLSTQCVEEEHERDFKEYMRRAWDLGECEE
ncbi:Taxadien-5-alpha-ol O-acetyltransferase [Platanthera guangdongensis]|uniref:Taxadien-5-alpha-ol O-acetyltransferase n=1 Tax=Platanthera guangdongensis TaxID=2320717 RepID=A0ABR2LEY0_9ASPA